MLDRLDPNSKRQIHNRDTEIFSLECASPGSAPEMPQPRHRLHLLIGEAEK
jgi:hypothetical protein